jgi:hypothetical protein
LQPGGIAHDFEPVGDWIEFVPRTSAHPHGIGHAENLY